MSEFNKLVEFYTANTVEEKINQIDHKEYPKRLKRKTEAELKFTIKDAKEAMKANPDSEKSRNGYYADEVNYAVMELNRRKKGGKMEEMKASDIRDIKKCEKCKKETNTKDMRDVYGDMVCPKCYGELEQYDDVRNEQNSSKWGAIDLANKYADGKDNSKELEQAFLAGFKAGKKSKENIEEARGVDDYVGKYFYKGITGGGGYEKPVKIKDAKKVKGEIEVLVGDDWLEYIPNVDRISKNK